MHQSAHILSKIYSLTSTSHLPKTGGSWSSGGWAGHWFDPWFLQSEIEVSLGKMLYPKLLPIHLYVNVCE